MKLIRIVFFCIVAIISALSCNKEEADPWRYLTPTQLKSNYIELRENTLLIPKEDQIMITSTSENEIVFSKDFKQELKVGDVIVNTGEGQENPKAFFRKIVGLSNFDQGLKVVTKEASLQEAYKRYYFNSDFEKNHLETRSNRFDNVFDLQGTNVSTSLGFTFYPNIDIRFGADSINFVTSYDSEAGTINNIFGPLHFRLVVRRLTFDRSISFTIGGKLESKFAAEFLPVLILPTNFGVGVYLTAKAEVSAGFEGSITTPTLSFPTLGPYDIVYDYNSIDGVTESSFINSPPVTIPAPAPNNWSYEGQGSVNIKVGFEIAIAPIGFVDNAKCGAFLYAYGEPSITKSGDFIDLQSKYNLNFEAGIGINFFADFSFFGVNEYSSTANWSFLNFYLSSPDFNYPLYNTSFTAQEICRFDAAYVAFQGNQTEINISKAGSVGYKIFFNDTVYNNGQVFDYNRPNFVSTQHLTNPVNKLTINDAIIQNCDISTLVVKTDFLPSDCDGFVTDPDGNRYCYKRFGSLLWMVENYKYTGPNGVGRYYNNAIEGWEQIYGRLYTFNEIMNGYNYLSGNLFKVQGICPNGWYLPSGAEFANLISILGGAANFGKNAKMNNPLIWPNSELPTINSFSAVSGGEYYKWANPDNQFGQRFKKGFYWTTDFTQDADFSNPHVKVFEINNSNIASNIGSVGPSFLKKTILDMGYSCRCVKDI